MSGGWFAKRARSRAGVSPVRMPTWMSALRSPRAPAAREMPCSGARRLRSTSWTSALSGETYSTRRACSGSAGRGSVISRSRHQRNAARVLPLPVGAQMSVCSPRAMAGQPCACAAVGASKAERNQSRVAGWNGASGSAWGVVVDRRGTGGEYRSPSVLEQAFDSLVRDAVDDEGPAATRGSRRRASVPSLAQAPGSLTVEFGAAPHVQAGQRRRRDPRR